MVRPCGARGFVDLVDAVLHYCIRPLIGASAPGPSWLSARMRPDSRTNLERASWVTSVRTRREDRSLHRRLILSQTSAGNSRETRSSIVSLLHAVPLSVPGGRSFVPACGREDQADQDAVALEIGRASCRESVESLGW